MEIKSAQLVISDAVLIQRLGLPENTQITYAGYDFTHGRVIVTIKQADVPPESGRVIAVYDEGQFSHWEPFKD